MDPVTLILGLALAALFWYYFSREKKYLNLPLGPRCLPIVGNAISMGKKPSMYLKSLSEIYGSIFTIWIGKNPVVVLTELEDVKEIYKLKEASGRPERGVLRKFTDNHGVAMSNGPRWISSRRMILQYLRDSSKNRIENSVTEAYKKLAYILDNHCDRSEPVDVAPLFMKAAFSVINFLSFGEVPDWQDEKFNQNISVLERNFQLILKVQALSLFKPWINPFIYKLEKEVIDNVSNFRQPIRKIVQERVAKFMESRDQDSDFIYNFLIAAEQEREEINGNNLFTNKQLEETMSDMFVAGTETTAGTLRWFFYYLQYDKESMRKIQEEIDAVIGTRMPSYDDRLKMPFTNACILETERIGAVAQFGILHTALEDIEYKGYTIPEGTDIMYNLWNIHRNEELWEASSKFNPDRFLNSESENFRTDEVIPFGIGRRKCPGEIIAKMEMFLFVVNLFQNYNFESIPGQPDSGEICTSGITRVPDRFEMRISRRA